jgi:hypothetical protein
MVAALTAIMCAATIGTVGRATRAEQEVRDRLESAGSRVAVLRDAKNAAVLPGLLVRQSSALDLVERAIGLTAPVDASTGALGGGGVPVAAWGMVGSPTEAVTLREGRLPQVGEALASEAAVRRLGLVQHVGWVLVGQREVSVVGVGTGNGAIAALRSGQIDAICNVDPVMTMLSQKNDVTIIADTRTLKGTEQLFGGPMPAGSLYAPDDFVQKNPNTTQALVTAMVKALRWIQAAGPSDIIKTVPEAYLLGDRALYLASFNAVRDAISPDGLISEAGARTTLTALASFNEKIKPAEIDLSRTYTNDFVKRAQARIK